MTSLWRAGFLATAVSAAVAVTATAAATSTHHQPPEEPLPQLRCELDGDKFICDTNGGLNSPNRGGPTGEEHSPSPASEQCCVSTMPLLPPGLNNCGGSRPVGLPFAGRSPVLAQRGMAATSQPLSTQAALDILKQGGNAVDAAIAANAMEGVVEPMMNGLGGDLMAIVWDPKTGKLQGINSSGRSSKSLSYDELKALLQSSRRRASDLGNEANAHEGNNVEQDKPLFLPTKGPLSVSVPGAAAGWCDLFDRFGSGNLTLAQVLAPAIYYASNGFPVSEVIAAEWADSMTANDSDATSQGRFPHAIDGFYATFSVPDNAAHASKGSPRAGPNSINVPGRRAPRAGEIFRNPDLAKTLTLIAENGCDAFYNGTIAQAIASFASIGGTHLTTEDMAAHTSDWVEPVNTTYRGNYRIFELPPNPQGIAAIQQLNILEGFNLSAMGFNSADYLHVHVEAKKACFCR
eukprot:INCI1127.2.p1 GENE.INCI1127.2~~INCI1127.2.p1  ORF type:complete len:462 (+),score=74.32 INCI1127.2:228-1613(+)